MSSVPFDGLTQHDIDLYWRARYDGEAVLLVRVRCHGQTLARVYWLPDGRVIAEVPFPRSRYWRDAEGHIRGRPTSSGKWVNEKPVAPTRVVRIDDNDDEQFADQIVTHCSKGRHDEPVTRARLLDEVARAQRTGRIQTMIVRSPRAS
jgi:hypothetical protein